MFYNSKVIFLSVPGLFHCLLSLLHMYKLKHPKKKKPQKNMGLDIWLPIKPSPCKHENLGSPPNPWKCQVQGCMLVILVLGRQRQEDCWWLLTWEFTLIDELHVQKKWIHSHGWCLHRHIHTFTQPYAYTHAYTCAYIHTYTHTKKENQNVLSI